MSIKSNVRFLEALVASTHDATHAIEDDDHEITIWYSKDELADIEEENDFLVDNANMLKKQKDADLRFCWRGLVEKKRCMPFVQAILELLEQDNKDWEAIRVACEEESQEAREKALGLGEKDREEALSAYQEDVAAG